jgi:hypothetical protein
VQIALAIGAVALLLAFAALCVPLHVAGSARLAASFDWRVRVRWAFVRFERTSDRPSTRGVLPPARRGPAERSPRDGDTARSSARRRSRLWSERGVWLRAARVVRAFAARVELRELRADCTFGLDDPADTGTLYGTLVPVLAAVEARHPAALAVRPSFAGARLDAQLSGEARVVPLRLLGPLAAFGWWLGRRYWRARAGRA